MEEKNYYFIEDSTDEDLIGFDSYVNSINNAIKNNSKFIGLVSDFGTGKSSLLKMLEKKDNSKIKLIRINLWNCEDSTNCENLVQDKIDIHRVFLHQLIDELKISPADYYKKMIDVNYSLFDIKFGNSRKIYGLFLLFIYILCIFEKLGFINLFLDKFRICGYILIAILTILCIIFYKPVISFKKDDTSRNINENDTKDLYQKIIKKYFELKSNRNKTLIICLEELDRYNNTDIILEYLKEFYKFYKISGMNVVFIVAINSSSKLCENTINNNMTSETIKNIYEKVFDYILNLQPINIQDYDCILLQLLKQKEENIPAGVILPSEDNIKHWRYLYSGKNIKIRDIKHRYNFAISLYLSTKESGIENVDFNKCLFIAYLEDEYPELYNILTSNNTLLNEILIEYSKNKNLDNINNEEINEEYKNVIMEGINSKFISVDYNYYFFKLPKNKKSYNIYELSLYNAIFFDEDNSQLPISLENLDDIQILKILKKRTNNIFIPSVVFRYPRLIKLSYENENSALINTLDKRYDLTQNFNKFNNMILNLKFLNSKLYRKICQEYFKLKEEKIISLSLDERCKLRSKLVALFRKDSIIFKNLFMEDNNLITIDEMNIIDEPSIIYELTNFEKVTYEYIQKFSKTINNASKTFVMKILKEFSFNKNITSQYYSYIFHSIDFQKFNFSLLDYKNILKYSIEKLELNNIKNFKLFIDKVNYYSEFYDQYCLSILNVQLIDEISIYVKIINKFEVIFEKGVEILNNCNTKYPLSPKILNVFYQNKYFKTYVICTTLREKIYDIEAEKFDLLSNEYVEHFVDAKEWKYKLSENMKAHLYKNVDMTQLSSEKLSLFVDMPQRIDMIEAVIAIDNKHFIDQYLSNINKILNKDLRDIFTLIGNYNRENGLSNKSRNNLKKLTNNQFCLQQLDARRKALS